jgi:Leucine-rich repeat (LRR) protein
MSPSELKKIITMAVREEREELDLAGRWISILPAEIGDCKKLKRLNLNNNSLREIPNSITRLTEILHHS